MKNPSNVGSNYFLIKRAFLHFDQVLFVIVLWMMIRNEIDKKYVLLVLLYGSMLLATSYKNLEILGKRVERLHGPVILTYYFIERLALCAYEWTFYFILLDMYCLDVGNLFFFGTMSFGIMILLVMYTNIDFSEKILDDTGVKRWFIYPFFSLE